MERLKHMRVKAGRAWYRYQDDRIRRGYRATDLMSRDLSGHPSKRKSLRLKLEVLKLKYLP